MNEPAVSTTIDEKPHAKGQSHYQQAIASLEHTLGRLRGCNEQEKEHLRRDLDQLREMVEKLTHGRVEIVLFGEISTGKSALVNALIGESVAEVDVQGGWTKDVWKVDWEGCAYCVPGLDDSMVVIVDTPGLNEVGGAERGEMAREAASRADLIVFATDSDLNETEFAALLSLAAMNKPIILVFNKIDLYTREQRARLQDVLRERLNGMLPEKNVVMAAADPREVEYVIEAADGKTRTDWRKPPPDVGMLKSRILEILETEGLALMALNGAMYAADKSDRIAALRVQLRNKNANQTIWSYATLKSLAVALNPMPVADVLGGTAVDVTMVITLAKIYGLDVSWRQSRKLVTSILAAAGWMAGGVAIEYTVNLAASAFKLVTGGLGTVVTAIPQGAAAGFGSYIVGQAAKHYFEHDSSWGGESPKVVVQRILQETDRQSVIEHLKEEIKRRMQKNPHARPDKKTHDSKS